jgi:hypothetical protein
MVKVLYYSRGKQQQTDKKMKKPIYAPEEIKTLNGTMKFHEEVSNSNTAQEILNGFRYLKIPATCKHLNGKHQIYRK